jgi:hypothetical protein
LTIPPADRSFVLIISTAHWSTSDQLADSEELLVLDKRIDRLKKAVLDFG